jgi:hypothetical protein
MTFRYLRWAVIVFMWCPVSGASAVMMSAARVANNSTIPGSISWPCTVSDTFPSNLSNLSETIADLTNALKNNPSDSSSNDQVDTSSSDSNDDRPKSLFDDDKKIPTATELQQPDHLSNSNDDIERHSLEDQLAEANVQYQNITANENCN